MTAKQLAAQQARSRDTEARIFRATSRVLEERGLEGATIPRIAKAAGVAAGTVYRRFQDKDALLRAVFLGRLETAQVMQSQMGSITNDWLGKYSLEGAVETIIAGLVTGYRMRHRLVRASLLYMETQADEAFRRRASALDGIMHVAMKEMLMKHRARIGHPEPEKAIAFAMQQLGATLMAVIGLESTGAWVKSLAMTDDDLKKELTRSFLAYLQVEQQVA